MMNDSTLAKVSSALASLSIRSTGQTAGQTGNEGSSANREQTDDQQGSESSQPFADVHLMFEAEKDVKKRQASPLQSFADFIVVHNLSTQLHVVPRFHGPKLVKLASLLANTPE